MKHDEWLDWGLSAAQECVLRDGNGSLGPANGPIREAARAAGWEFSSDSPLSFVSCPACKRLKDDELPCGWEARVQVRQALVEMVGDDTEDIAVLVSDGLGA